MGQNLHDFVWFSVEISGIEIKDVMQTRRKVEG